MDNAKKFSCKCGVAFTSERSLNFHRGSRACRLRDPAAVRFSCSECKFTAYYQITLDKHMQIRHSNKTPFECKCGTSFGQLEALLEHQTSALACQKYHTCKLCGHISPTQGQLNRHLRSHSEEKPFVCGCGRAYPRKDSYYRHKRSCRSFKDDESITPANTISEPQPQIQSTCQAPQVLSQAIATQTPTVLATQAPAAPPVTPSTAPQVVKAPLVAPQAQPVAQVASAVPQALTSASSTPAPQASNSSQLPPLYKPRVENLPSPRELAFMRPPSAFYGVQQPISGAPPPPVQVHAPMFVPHYMSQYVRMNAHQDAHDPPPPPSQLMNLSYLASMKAPLNAPVPSDLDVPALGRE